MKNKNEYITPVMNIIVLQNDDIVCTSASLGDPNPNADLGDLWTPKDLF